jgi:hypothetical protein
MLDKQAEAVAWRELRSFTWARARKQQGQVSQLCLTSWRAIDGMQETGAMRPCLALLALPGSSTCVLQVPPWGSSSCPTWSVLLVRRNKEAGLLELMQVMLTCGAKCRQKGETQSIIAGHHN